MKRILTLLMVVAPLLGIAQKVSPEQAMSIAKEFITQTHPGTGILLKEVHIDSRSVDASDPQDLFYVFNADNNRGFVIIAGDTRAKRILGYSDTGNLDVNNLPPQLEVLFDEYTRQIKSVGANAKTDASWSFPISKMTAEMKGKVLKTANWNQGYPYNALCPEIDGKKCLAGCVATAMAIVMRYNEWPKIGRGEHHYKWDCQSGYTGNVVSQTLAANFESSEYDYDIPYETQDITSATSLAAVGKLMLDAGISVDMSYTPEASGSSEMALCYALKEYFRYSKDCQYITRIHFQKEEWINLISSQIDNGYPIIYSGFNNNGNGHVYVLDGYDESRNYFHFNFGGGGAGNGFYCLDVTDAPVFTYAKDQGMVINIIPDPDPREYSRAYVEAPYLLFGKREYYGMGLNMNVREIKPNEPFDVNINTLFLPSNFSGWYGCAIVDEKNNVKEILWKSEKNTVEYGKYLVPSTSVVGVMSHLKPDELTPTDRLQVVTRYEGEDEWRMVSGTFEAPSSRPICGYNPALTPININTDNNVDIYLTTLHNNDYGFYGNNPIEGSLYHGLGGSSVVYRFVPKELKQDYVLTFDIDGFFNGEWLNRVRTTLFNNDEVIGFFDCQKDAMNITVKYQKGLILDVVSTSAGKLNELISEEDARNVVDLTLSGPLNIYDMWYINDIFQSLQTIDLSKAYFIETEVTEKDNDKYITILSPIQSSEMLPGVSFYELKRLKTVKLPEYLKYIEGKCFFLAYGIKDFELPKNIELIGTPFLYECVGLETIKSFNPIPPKFMAEEGNFWDPISFEKVKLFVPIGSKQRYETAPVWSKFKNIEEFDPLAGIDNIKNGSDNNQPIEIFNLIGIKIDLSKEALPPGIYIFKRGDFSKKVVIN